MGLIKLSDAIENLREELRLAQEKGKNQSLQFDLQSIELELEVIAEGESGVSGKINWYIFGGGVDSKVKDATKHKLKLTLKAVDASGQPIRVSSSELDRPD
ncbi:trypco2 family protein [Phormidesmis sp. 146-35]